MVAAPALDSGEAVGQSVAGKSAAAAAIGPFNEESPFPGLSPFRSTQPTFADIDGDSDFDAFVGENDGRILFFENTGDASNPDFAPAVINPFGLTSVVSSASPDFVDIDGDGDLDALVGVGSNPGTLVFFENTDPSSGHTSPGFAAAVTNPFGFPAGVVIESTIRPTFADIDGDGDFDLFISMQKNGVQLADTWFFENTDPSSNHTNPGFSSGNSTFLGWSGFGDYLTPEFVDIDGDQDFDLFVGENIGILNFFENTDGSTGHSSPGFTAPVSNNPFGLADVGNTAAPAFVDIDDDGDLDAFIGESSPGVTDLNFYENTGDVSNPAFFRVPGGALGIPGVPQGGLRGEATPVFVDIDGDGDSDLFAGERDGHFWYFENTDPSTNHSSPVFAARSANPFGLADVGTRSAPTFVDIDGDGDFDAFAGELNGATFFFENTDPSTNHTSPGFTGPNSASPFGITDVGLESAPSFLDVDGDGDFDAFVGERSGDLFFFENTDPSSNHTSPGFASPNSNDPFGIVGSAATRSPKPAFVDIDQDGDFDVVVGTDVSGHSFFENTDPSTGHTSPGFTGPNTTEPFGITNWNRRVAPAFVDIDNDGDFDAFVGEYPGTIVFFRNDAASAPLPVELVSFGAITEEGVPVLRWQTASETNNAGFEVEHAPVTADGTGEFRLVAFVAGHGTSQLPATYEYRADELAVGTHRFRLKQIDYDGTSDYSSVVEVMLEVPGTHILSGAYPNPFNPSAQFALLVSRDQVVDVNVYDIQGRLVTTLFKGELTSNKMKTFVLDGAALPSGTYVYRVVGETFTESKTVVLSK